MRKHAHDDEQPRRSPESQLADAPLFASFAPPAVPVIRTEAKSAQGSETSREAAELVSVDGECLRCLLWYAKQPGPRTRYELAAAVYPVVIGNRDVMGIGNACGRTNDLVELKYLEEVGRNGRRATLAVTSAGRAWLEKRGALAA